MEKPKAYVFLEGQSRILKVSKKALLGCGASKAYWIYIPRKIGTIASRDVNFIEGCFTTN